MSKIVSFMIALVCVSSFAQAESSQMYRVYYTQDRCDWKGSHTFDNIYPLAKEITENVAKASARYKKDNYSVKLQILQNNKLIYSTFAFNGYRKSPVQEGANDFTYSCTRGSFFDIPAALLQSNNLTVKLDELTAEPRHAELVVKGTFADLLKTTGKDLFAITKSTPEIIHQGSSQTQFKLLVLGDGYEAKDLNKFTKTSQEMTSFLLKQKPFSDVKENMVVQRISVTAQSGPEHRDSVTYLSPFNSMVFDDSQGAPVMNNAFYYDLQDRYQADQVVMIINFKKYCGYSNDMASVCSEDPSANYTIAHELGHSLAIFRDTYFYGKFDEVMADPISNKLLGSNTSITPEQAPWNKYVTNPQLGPVYFSSPKWETIGQGESVARAGIILAKFDSDKVRMVGEFDIMPAFSGEHSALVQLYINGQKVTVPMQVKTQKMQTTTGKEALTYQWVWDVPVKKGDQLGIVLNRLNDKVQVGARAIQLASRDFSVDEISWFEGSGLANVGMFRPTFISNTNLQIMVFNAYEQDVLKKSILEGYNSVICEFNLFTCVR